MEWEKDSVMWNWVRVTIWLSMTRSYPKHPMPFFRPPYPFPPTYYHDSSSPSSMTRHPPPLLRLLLLLLSYFVTYYNYHKYSSSSTSAADLLLITLVYDSSSPSTYFTYSPPYFLLPPATYPLQQLLVPVHHPYSFTNHLPHRRDLLQQQHPWLLLPLPQLWQVPVLLVILPVPHLQSTLPPRLLHTSLLCPVPHLQFYYNYFDYHQRRAACQTSKPYSDCE